MSDQQPIPDQYRAMMNQVAGKLDELFYPNTFLLLISEPGERASGKRTNYISNGRRDDMHRVLQEFLDDDRINFGAMSDEDKQTAIEERAYQLLELAKKLGRTLIIENGNFVIQKDNHE